MGNFSNKCMHGTLLNMRFYSFERNCVLALLHVQYSAEELGGHGGGGEYNVQFGFGWSNGVIIEFLAKYGDILTPDD